MFVPLFLGGQTRHAPTLKRACLDRVSGELTLLLEPGKDTCTFQKYRLWGRTDTFAEYELLDEATSFNLLTWNKVLPNKKLVCFLSSNQQPDRKSCRERV